MKKFSLKAKIAAGVVAVAAATAIVVPTAFGWFYTGPEVSAESTDTGVVEVAVTLDTTTLKGGQLRARVIYCPSNATVQDCADQMLTSSQDQEGLKAIHNYDFSTMAADYMNSDKYTVEATIYECESQNPGCQMTHDTEGTKVAASDFATTSVERFDNVVFKVTKK